MREISVKPVVATLGKLLLVGWCGLASAAFADESGHWAFRPLATQAISEPTSSASDVDLAAAAAIDRFINSELQAQGLVRAGPAAPEVLLRRLTFVLTGLPPTRDQQQRFANDPSLAAYRALVDELIDSTAFAERWGRHWLDVARFAESSGGGRSIMFPEAWRYRDYVIDAVDRDLPFNRFIVEQLAGDLMPYDSDDQRDRQLIATGFLVLGAINYELQDKALLDMEVADEQIEAMGRAFLGMSLGCARCHDHKFDPVTQDEYYSLAGFFTSTKSVSHANVGAPHQVPLDSGPDVQAYRKHQEQIAQLARQLEQLKLERLKTSADPASQDAIAKLEADIAQAKKSLLRRPMAMAAIDAEKVGDTHLRLGGDAELLGPIVPRGVLAIAGPGTDIEIADAQSGRLQLAEWIASPHNHLTSRVIVNRIWLHTIGQGIVRTPDDFGTTGTPPTHPELLDHLARRFVDSGWSIKTLVRQIVLSETFRRDSVAPNETMSRDPSNLYLARAHVRHLDAESLRDAMLAVSGRLDRTVGGPTIGKLATHDYGYQFNTTRRSVYVPRFRSEPLDAFTIFDCANPNMVTGRREQSILPAQALFMLNSPLAIESAAATAKNLLAEFGGDDIEDLEQRRIDELFRRLYARAPTSDEQQFAEHYLRTARQADGATELAAYSDLCQLLLASIDHRFLR